MDRITFLVLGLPAEKWPILGLPEGAKVERLQRVLPGPGGHGRLYRQRVKLIKMVKTEFFCFLDGDNDVLLPNFKETMLRYMAQDKPIAYGGEYRNGVLFPSEPWTPTANKAALIMHHAVLCKTALAQTIKWPDGCYMMEGVLYNTLAQQGFYFDTQKPCYDWKPGCGGARLWNDMARARENSYKWVQRKDLGIHLPEDFK